MSFQISLRRLLLAALTLTLITFGARAQAPAWQWATSLPEGGDASTAVDAAGNVYVAGKFSGTAIFGPDTLTSAGLNDVFVARLTSSGAWDWAVGVGGPEDDAAGGVAVDAAGNVVVTGSFQSPAITIGATVLLNGGAGGFNNGDVFVAKLSPAGMWQWATSAAGSGNDLSTGLGVDRHGNVLLTGYFSSPTATFGATTLPGSANRSSVFVARLTPAGAWQWAVGASGGGNCFSRGLAVDGNGDALVTGQSDVGVTFGTRLVTDLFVARLDTAGVWQWAVGAGSGNGANGRDVSNGIAVDGSGNAVVTGFFYGPITVFGSITLNHMSTNGSNEVFVAKLNSAGVWQWAVKAGGSEYEEGRRVAIDAAGNVLVSGEYNSFSATFGTTTLTNHVGIDRDMFVAKLTPAGAWQWATWAGGTDDDLSQGLAVDDNGNVYMSGTFWYNSTFGTTTLQGQSPNFFIARLGSITTGLPPDEPGASLAIYPNPAHETVCVRSLPPGISCVQVLDALGRVVRTASCEPQTANLDLTELPAGLYLVRAGNQTKRLVVE